MIQLLKIENMHPNCIGRPVNSARKLAVRCGTCEKKFVKNANKKNLKIIPEEFFLNLSLESRDLNLKEISRLYLFERFFRGSCVQQNDFEGGKIF